MEPMRPVDAGQQRPAEPQWQRWGWRATATASVLLGLALALSGRPLWMAVAISLALTATWHLIETVAKRKRRSEVAA